MCISITFLVILPFLYFLPYLLHHLLTSLIPSFLPDRQHRWERVRGAHQVSERSVSNSFDWLAMLYYDWSSSTSHSFNLQIPLLSLINDPLLFHSFSLPSPLTHSASPLLSFIHPPLSSPCFFSVGQLIMQRPPFRRTFSTHCSHLMWTKTDW